MNHATTQTQTLVGTNDRTHMTTSSALEWVPLPAALVADALCLYPDSHRHLRQLCYYCGMVRALVEPHQIDYSTITVPYYTAQQIVEITSQMAYLLAAATMILDDLAELPRTLYPSFAERMRAGNIYYTGLDIRFRRKASNAMVQPATISLKRSCAHAGMQVVLSSMDFGKGCARVGAQLMMPLGG